MAVYLLYESGLEFRAVEDKAGNSSVVSDALTTVQAERVIIKQGIIPGG